MSISGVSSTTGVSLTQSTSKKGSAAVPTESAAQIAQNQNEGSASKASSAQAPSTGKSNSSDVIKLRRLVSEHMSIGSIAQQLGKSVSAVMQEAAAAGISLNAQSSSSTATTMQQAAGVGNNVDVKA